MSYEVYLQYTLLYHLLAVGEDNLSENGKGVRDFRLTLYKLSEDSHLCDKQHFLYLTRVYQPRRSGCFLPSLNCVQLFIDLNHVWSRGKNVFYGIDDVTAEILSDPVFVHQGTAPDSFILRFTTPIVTSAQTFLYNKCLFHNVLYLPLNFVL
ncbi:hypothetical protein TNCV_1628131 [Trichonephila clavipes]|nr:hypothetical protein TNCV_1628131 [Trichonephila clavipes]